MIKKLASKPLPARAPYAMWKVLSLLDEMTAETFDTGTYDEAIVTGYVGSLRNQELPRVHLSVCTVIEAADRLKRYYLASDDSPSESSDEPSDVDRIVNEARAAMEAEVAAANELDEILISLGGVLPTTQEARATGDWCVRHILTLIESLGFTLGMSAEEGNALMRERLESHRPGEERWLADAAEIVIAGADLIRLEVVRVADERNVSLNP